MSYAPVNNLLVMKGDKTSLARVCHDTEVYSKLREVSIGDSINIKDLDISDGQIGLYYETDGEPHEEVPTFIKEKYPNLRVFFSSIDYDCFCFAYYKEIGKPTEYNYDTEDEDEIDKKFKDFINTNN